jgi:excisionase family DNA binding protein
MMSLYLDHRLAFSIKEAAAVSGIGRTAIFAAIKAGRLIARKNGRRTLIASSDLQQFIASLPKVDRSDDHRI